eukprot:scaffold487_cov344-Prasinococcus_capsulatus_cf.AAC.2
MDVARWMGSTTLGLQLTEEVEELDQPAVGKPRNEQTGGLWAKILADTLCKKIRDSHRKARGGRDASIETWNWDGEPGSNGNAVFTVGHICSAIEKDMLVCTDEDQEDFLFALRWVLSIFSRSTVRLAPSDIEDCCAYLR